MKRFFMPSLVCSLLLGLDYTTEFGSVNVLHGPTTMELSPHLSIWRHNDPDMP